MVFCENFIKFFALKNFIIIWHQRGLVIYPGKLTEGLSFRIGSIGEVYEKNILELVEAIKLYLSEKKIEIPI